MQTKLILTITHSKPIPNLADIAAGRVYSVDGVQNAEAVEQHEYDKDTLVFMDELCGVAAHARNAKAPAKEYICPQCGKDENGGDVHQLTHHTWPALSLNTALIQVGLTKAQP